MLTRSARGPAIRPATGTITAVTWAAVIAALWLIGAGAAEALAASGGVWGAGAALATVCALGGLWAAAAREAAAARALGLTVPRGVAMQAGAAASGVGQALGLGALTGGVARWRMLTDQGVGDGAVVGLTAVVAAAWLCGLALTGAVATVASPEKVADLLPASPGAVWTAATIVIALLTGLALAGLVTRGRCAAFATAALYSAAQAAAAGAALWMLAPAEGFAAATATAAASLGVSLAAPYPMGGGFPGAAWLTAVPAAEAAATLLTYRATVFGAPMLVGAALFCERAFGRPGARAVRRRRRVAARRAGMAAPALIDAARVAAAVGEAESGRANLAWAGDKKFLFSPGGDGFIMYRVSAGALLALGDPVGPRRLWPDLIDRAMAEARKAGLAPVFCGAGPKTATLARSRGLAADRIGREALADPAAFTTAHLRRETADRLADAARAGLRLDWRAAGEADLARLSRINAAWSAAEGPERGFARGRFDPAYLSRFPIIEAGLNGRPVGFVSILPAGANGEWALDLARMTPDAPEFALPALVAAAVAAARDGGAARLSLGAAALSPADGPQGPAEWIAARFTPLGEPAPGLRNAADLMADFATEWRPLHLLRPPGCAPLAFLAASRLIGEADRRHSDGL